MTVFLIGSTKHNGTYQIFCGYKYKNQYKTHKNFSNSAIYGGIETFDIKAPKLKLTLRNSFWLFFALRKSQPPRYNYLNV